MVILRVADRLVLLSAAEITTEVGRVTRLVVMLKVAVVAPAGTMMLAGTVAMLVLLLTKRIMAPPEGAGALSVTVPVETEPPRTLVGLSVSLGDYGSCHSGVRNVRFGTLCANFSMPFYLREARKISL